MKIRLDFALRLTLLYILIGGLWILFSDRLVALLFTNPRTLLEVNTIKGWFFIVVTAFLLFAELRRESGIREHDEEALRESEDKFKYVFDHSVTGKSLTLPSGELNANQAFCEMLGYSQEELQNCKIQEISHPDDLELTQNAMKVLLSGEKETIRFTKRFIHKNGSTVWADVGAALRRDHDGKPLYFMTSVNDITGRIQAEETVLSRDKRFKMLIENSADAITLIDANRIAIYDSPGAPGMLGYGYEEWIGHDVFELLHPDDLFNIQNLFQNLKKTPGGRVEATFRLRNNIGSWVWVKAVATNMLDEPSVKAIVVNYRDITERKKAEDALKISEEKYRTLHESMIDGFVSVDINGKYLEYNEVYRKMLGYSDADFAQLTYEDVTPVKWHAFEKNILVNQILKRGYSDDYHKEYRRKDGTIFPVELHTILVRDEHGQPVSMWAIVRDITARKQAEEKLRKSEELFSTAFHTSPDSININRLEDGTYVDINEGFTAITGYTREEIIGRTSLEINIWDDPADRARLVAGLQKNGQVNNLEAKFRMKNGHVINALMSAKIIMLNDIPHILSITRDIEEIKQVQEKLRESEQRYRKLFEDMPIAIWEEDFSQVKGRLDALKQQGITDFRTYFATHPEKLLEYSTMIRILDINHAALQMYRSESKEELFTATHQGLSVGEVEHLSEDLIAIAEGKTSHSWEGKDGTLTGESVEVSLSWSVVPGYEQDFSKVIVTTIDITERKKAEETLRRSEEQYRLITQHVDDVVWQLNMNLQFIYLSPSVERVLGYTVEEACQLRVTDLLDHNGIEQMKKVIQERLSGTAQKALKPSEYLMKHKDGHWIPVEVVSSPVFDNDNNPVGFVGITRDVTERKQAEEEIRQLNADLEKRVVERTAQLQDAQEQLVRQEKLALLGQLAGGVGHELRNPLGVISNAVYYLRLIQPDADEKVNEYLGIIANETNTAEKIITDLLDFSRIKSVDREPIALADLVRLVLERFPPSEDIKVEQKLPEDLPIVYADPRQMAQVLGNLVVNACQAMQNGGTLILSARIKKKEVALSVKDTGMGIPPENMKKLFEPLFTTKAKGIGLGLAVSKKLAEANEGRIEVVSEPGKGSTFIVYLPVSREME